MSQIIEGKDLMLFISDSVSGTYKSIGAATNCSIEVTMDTKETTTKDSASGHWATSTANKLSWSASSDNLFTTTPDGEGYDELYAAMVAREPIFVKFGQTTKSFAAGTGWTVASSSYQGSAYITALSLSAGSDDSASFSVSLTGIGELKHVTA